MVSRMRQVEGLGLSIAAGPSELAVVRVPLGRRARVREVYEVREVIARLAVEAESLRKAGDHLVAQIAVPVDDTLQVVRRFQPHAPRETPMRKPPLLPLEVHVTQVRAVVEVVVDFDAAGSRHFELSLHA